MSMVLLLQLPIRWLFPVLAVVVYVYQVQTVAEMRVAHVPLQ